ncbi:MAG: erythromycin biosynthesis sensory transduction protein eryC1 [Acidobacteria bacterium]|nr:MAG: erythromycin biosynthesis sensory transduction protein eryC1 [Acidobacteriota bacterium]
MTLRRIPFTSTRPHEDAAAIRDAIDRVVASGWFILGPEVEAFEAAFAAASGAAHAVGVASGTDAIALVLRALGVGHGDEVITTSLSAAFTALAIMSTGARPIFVDVDDARLTLDPAGVAGAVTARTRAIVPVHLYGQPADMTGLAAVASRHHLALVEDCCQAHLATAGGAPVGTIGVAGAFSFYPTKNLAALGDGGAVVTNDGALADRIRRLRNGGQTTRDHFELPGINSRLDEIQAAILRARLPLLADRNARRRMLAATYRRRLASSLVRAVPEVDAGHVYHLFVVRSRQRAALQAHLLAAGIETLVHYPVPVTRQPALGSMHPVDCPLAATACNEVLSLPLHPAMALEDVEQVSEEVCRFPEDMTPCGR